MIGGVAIVAAIAGSQSESRLSDPNDDRALYLRQLPDRAKLSGRGTFRVTVYRVSGYVHASHDIEGTAAAALDFALSTFRRAQIDAVNVGTNTERELTFGRIYANARGRTSGKAVARATIVRIAEEAPQPAPMPRHTMTGHVGLTCDDCGTRDEVSVEEMKKPHFCSNCGSDTSLTAAQIDRIERSIAAALADAEERIRAGEQHVQLDVKMLPEG